MLRVMQEMVWVVCLYVLQFFVLDCHDCPILRPRRHLQHLWAALPRDHQAMVSCRLERVGQRLRDHIDGKCSETSCSSLYMYDCHQLQFCAQDPDVHEPTQLILAPP